MCVHRTGPKEVSHRWNVRNRSGFVARAWHEQVRIDIPELPADADADAKKKYLDETWVDEKTYATLSWPGAAMVASPLIFRPGDDPVAVFLVEGKGVDVPPAHRGDLMKKRTFRVPPELNEGVDLGRGVRVAAAPFDTPSEVDIEELDGYLHVTFHYPLGEDESTRQEALPSGMMFLGQRSGRIMRVAIRDFGARGPTGELTTVLEHLRRRLEVATREMKPGAPMREAAHYKLLTQSVLPEVIISQLPALREQTK